MAKDMSTNDTARELALNDTLQQYASIILQQGDS